MKLTPTIIAFCLLLCINFAPEKALAQAPTATGYKLLAPLPGYVATNAQGETTASSYIRGIFTLMIAIAGGLAVIKIIFGGIQYMSTDAFQGKTDAKNSISNAIWGLLLAISAWLILYTINPKLVELEIFIPPQPISIPTTSPGGVVPGSCTDCVNITVGTKPPMMSPTVCGHESTGGCGCAFPGPCKVQGELNARLMGLKNKNSSLFINEAYPPTVPHKEACHNNGTCVDAAISSYSPQNVKKFLEDARDVGLGNSIFEAASQARVDALVRGGVPASQVIITSGNGEHFHVRLQ